MKEVLEQRKKESEAKLIDHSKQINQHQAALAHIQQLLLQEQGRYNEIVSLLQLGDTQV